MPLLNSNPLQLWNKNLHFTQPQILTKVGPPAAPATLWPEVLWPSDLGHVIRTSNQFLVLRPLYATFACSLSLPEWVLLINSYLLTKNQNMHLRQIGNSNFVSVPVLVNLSCYPVGNFLFFLAKTVGIRSSICIINRNNNTYYFISISIYLIFYLLC